MLLKDHKDMIDSLDILQQAELVRNRAKEIQKEHRTFSDRKAFKLASDEILRGITWSY